MNDGKKKVRVLHFLPRWDNGGMEHAALDIITHFQNRDFTYEICTAFLESEYGFSVLSEKKIAFTVFYKNKEYSFIECVIRLYSYLKNKKYDIVHCHINNAIGLIFAAVAKSVGVQWVVVHTHNNAFGSGKILIKKILRKISIILFSGQPDLFLACSDNAGKWSFGEKIEKSGAYHVVYNGIELKRFCYDIVARSELREKYALSGKYVIGHIGHFNYQKNQVFLLKIIRNTLRQIPNAHFFFVGTGETKEGFLKVVDDLKVEDYVTVIDTVNNPQDYYSMFDLFAFPSHFEGFGIVMIEAQMSGLPIICSEHVLREIDISHHVRYLPIDTEDSVTKWTDSIVECYQQERKIERTQIRECKQYDISVISTLIEGYYSELMEKG